MAQRINEPVPANSSGFRSGGNSVLTPYRRLLIGRVNNKWTTIFIEREKKKCTSYVYSQHFCETYKCNASVDRRRRF